MPIVYRVMHDHDIAADGDDRDRALAAELRALGWNAGGAALAGRIELAIDNGSTVEIDEAATLEAMARALDHRRNAARDTFGTPAEERDFPPAHVALRDHLIDRLGYRAITYRLRGWDHPPTELWSYTGVYANGDRIVTGDGRAWRAANVKPSSRADEGEIEVEPWLDA